MIISFAFAIWDWKEQPTGADFQQCLDAVTAEGSDLAELVISDIKTYQDSYAMSYMTKMAIPKEEQDKLAQHLYEWFHQAETGEDEFLAPYYVESAHCLRMPLEVVKEILDTL